MPLFGTTHVKLKHLYHPCVSPAGAIVRIAAFLIDSAMRRPHWAEDPHQSDPSSKYGTFLDRAAGAEAPLLPSYQNRDRERGGAGTYDGDVEEEEIVFGKWHFWPKVLRSTHHAVERSACLPYITSPTRLLIQILHELMCFHLVTSNRSPVLGMA